MNKNNKINLSNNSIDLVIDKIGDNYVLINKNEIEQAISNKNKIHDELFDKFKNKEHIDIDDISVGDINYAPIVEINRHSSENNSWLDPIEYLVIDTNSKNSNNDLAQSIVSLENKVNKLYEDLSLIVIKKYKIYEEDKINEIFDLYKQHDSDIKKYLDLVNDVIYNIEVDWNDELLIDKHLSLFNTYTKTLKDDDYFFVNNNSDQISDSDEVKQVSFNIKNIYNVTKTLNQIIEENQSKINSKELYNELENHNNDELNEYLNNLIIEINYVQNILEDKIDLYKNITKEDPKEKAVDNEKFIELMDTLSSNSETIQTILSDLQKTEDNEQIKSLFNQRHELDENSISLIKKLKKFININENLSALNEEIITLKVVLDNLYLKLSIAYEIANFNYVEYTKKIQKRNAKLAKESKKQAKIDLKNQKANLIIAKKTQKKLNQIYSDENAQLIDQIITNYNIQNNDGLKIITNIYGDYADTIQEKTFKKYLSDRINDLKRYGKDLYDNIDDQNKLIDKYFLFINSELGIISELNELVKILELKRVKLITEIAENDILTYKTDFSNVNNKINFTVRSNFAIFKILSAELLVLKAMLQHREYLSVIRQQAKSVAEEFTSTFIEWGIRLKNTRDRIWTILNNVNNLQKYKNDENITYLISQIREFHDNNERINLEQDNLIKDQKAKAYDDEQPYPEVLIMKFERTVGKEKIVHKEIIKKVIEKQEIIQEVGKVNNELVEEKAKVAKKAKRLSNKGMSLAGLRIEELINDTKKEIQNLENNNDIKVKTKKSSTSISKKTTSTKKTSSKK